MQCLKNYIGLRYCGNPSVPDGGLYVNDLQGINLIGLDKIADAEQQTFAGVWESIQTRALQRFPAAVIAEFGRRFKIKTVTESVTLPAFVNKDTNQTGPATEKRGFTLKIGSENWVSPLQVIHVQSLQLYLNAAGAATIKFYKVEGAALTEVLSIPVANGVEGWNNVNVNRNFSGITKLFIGYDATAITSVETKFDTSLDSCDCDACDCYSCGLTIQPATYDGTDLTTGNNTFGLSGVVGARCSFEAVVCNNKSLFATALWYLLGAETMAERLNSDRINRYTTVGTSKAEKLREEFEFFFGNELRAAVAGINLNLSDCCLECNQVVTSVEMHP